jgi:succinate dehydrogenase flavin-adding protein (antitoxin of CptAB toxin-antitoxin module)
LGSFVEKYIKLFNEGELQMLEAILELDDNDIYRYALDKVTIPKEIDNRVMQLLKDFTMLKK